MTNAPALQEEPSYLKGLNPPQRDAVLTTEGPVLVLAGAGTGKTRALTARLTHLIATRRAWPSQILAVTFTNKAAREMRERMAHMLGAHMEGLPWLGTFHAVCARMLRMHAELVGLKPNFIILDTDDQLRLLKQLITAADIDEKRFPARLLASIIDRWKNRGWTPEILPDDERFAYAEGQGRALYAQYQARLKTLNAADFGDLLLHCLQIFLQHPEVLKKYQNQLRYIMVDEYQDTNIAQYMWLRLLAQNHHNICCVGDDDQSIYSWRGAEVANILKFEQDFSGAKIIRLEQNYRSTAPILEAAGQLIAHNQGRLGKTLWTQSQGGDPVRVIGLWDGAEEARHIGAEIEQLQRDDIGLDNVAILVRAQFQTREFEDRFIAIGLPYRIVGGFRFYERQEIRDALAYLRLVIEPADDLAFERIINTPKRGLGERSLQKIHAHARKANLPLLLAAQHLAQSDELGLAARKALTVFVQNISRWRDLLSSETPAQLAAQILEDSGYIAMWQADRSVDAAGRLENLSELTRAMEEYETLGAFLEHVALVMENEQAEERSKVTLMTLHAAKGLEFDHVFLVGWEEGVFPSQRALDEGGLASLEEERRLAYVGLTRARKTAVITHAANRRIYGQWTSSLPSRFIGELPADHITMASTYVHDNRGWKGAFQGGEDGFSQQWSSRGRPQPAMHQAKSSKARPIAPARDDLHIGQRIFHTKFGYGHIVTIEDNKLEIEFELSGRKHVLDSFIDPA